MRGTALLIAAVLTLGLPVSGAAASDGLVRPSGTTATAGPATTGVPAGTKLTVRYGDIKVTQPGTVIDGLDVRGIIWVQAPNVTIRNTIVRGRAITSNLSLIHAGSAAGKNLLIEDVELAPSVRSVHWTGIYGGNFTLRRADIHDVVDAVHIFADDVKIYGSWFHDLSHFAYDPWHDNHSKEDAIEIVQGSRIDIRGNTLVGGNTAAVMVAPWMGPVSDLTVSGNFLSGGSCTVNIAEKNRPPIAGLVVTRNYFGTSGANCNVIVDARTRAIADISNNWRSDGKRVIVFSR